MLIIEIALGIVLAVVILIFWRQILGYGLLGILGIAVISVFSIGGYYAYENFDSVIGLVAGIGIIAAIIGAIVLSDVVGSKISELMIKKWDWSIAEVGGYMFLMSVFFFSVHLMFDDDGGVVAGGILLMFIDVIFAIAHWRKVIANKKKRATIRFIEESYAETNE